MPRSSWEWLTTLLASHQPDEADARQLVLDCSTEDALIEYKAASWVNTSRAAADLREYVAAFANVSGGIIVLGYDRAAGTFGDAKPPGRDALEDWMANATAPLRPYFHLPPRQLIVRMSEGTIGIVVVPRSLTLIPVQEGNARRYPVRWGATKQNLPEDLALDILLGRRRNPYLRAELGTVFYHLLGSGRTSLQAGINLTVENAGLVFAEGVRLGLVCWVFARAARALAPVQTSLRESVDAIEPVQSEWAEPWTLTHFGKEREDDYKDVEIAPFEVSSEHIVVKLLPRFRDPASISRERERDCPDFGGRVTWCAGLYVLARNTEPLWYQPHAKSHYLAHRPTSARRSITPCGQLSRRPRSASSASTTTAEGGRVPTVRRHAWNCASDPAAPARARRRGGAPRHGEPEHGDPGAHLVPRPRDVLPPGIEWTS